jgi:hypothetical protein
MRHRRFTKVATMASVLALSGSALHSVATAKSVARSHAAGSFCSKPVVGVDEGEPAVKARLGINRTIMRPGGTLRVRIEDLGTKDLSYDLAYQLARRSEGVWTNLPPKAVFGPRLHVRAGTASECQSIEIPRHARLGRYRITKKLGVVGVNKELVVRATFSVLPPA